MLPDDSERLKKFKKNLQEIVDAMVRKSAEDELIKEIKKQMKEEFGVPLAKLSKIATAKFKRNAKEQVEDMHELEAAFDQLDLKSDAKQQTENIADQLKFF